KTRARGGIAAPSSSSTKSSSKPAPKTRTGVINPPRKCAKELELLQLGKSVMRKRTLQQRRAVCEKAGVGSALFALPIAAAPFFLHGQSDGELHSANPEAEALVAVGNQVLTAGIPNQVRTVLKY